MWDIIHLLSKSDGWGCLKIKLGGTERWERDHGVEKCERKGVVRGLCTHTNTHIWVMKKERVYYNKQHKKNAEMLLFKLKSEKRRILEVVDSMHASPVAHRDLPSDYYDLDG